MNQEYKNEWVKALRSGEYEQGTGKLCSIDENGKNSFCCLGVLYDLAVKKEPEKFSWDNKSVIDTAYPVSDNISDDGILLPEWFVEHINFEGGSSGKFIIDDDEFYLYDMNDDGMTFNQIADSIERNF
jgi:hypothetical protein